MANFTKFQCFVGDVGLKKHDLNADTLKIMLTNSTPNAATNTVKTDLTDITAQNGYTAGGVDIQNTYSQTAGVGTLAATDFTITASGGSYGPFRYAILYNDTAASKNLIGYWDYGTAVTVATTEDFTVDFGTSVLTLT